MASSPVDLCSRALLKIGANTITSFDEGTAEAEVAASLCPLVRDALLAVHPWNFGIVCSELPRLATSPIADYAHAFRLPPDCLRVLSAGTGDRGSGIVYSVRGAELHTDVAAVTLTYVRRVGEDGFPVFFQSVLVAQLAAEFCIPLTDSTSRWESMSRVADSEFRRAKLIDAQEDTPARLRQWTLVEERF
jgi:hypothetical protein